MISFFMTLALILITKSIRRQFISKIRLPELRKTLVKLGKEMSEYNPNTSSESDMQRCFGQTKAQLKEAKSILAKNERKIFENTIKEIELLMKSGLSTMPDIEKDKYWKMYGHLNECIETISQYCSVTRQT